ncbi:ATP-binding cassette domain-containing protein [Deinococcus hopiensis]|uniref:ABC-type antimicrobial peptide transport system, ATPase component n=1 Tax=Deinococcus hopiensis KR-140 TaxID=695939 RepID=A0A1W1VU63_9DEIO|nr:ATP-binding cassette domain-containing protein [Deinococcus hopiensis]SMB96889.1 ABC-type antimicrobial peptide transport system, ATPase component [Deinococcus hopiensis KR-140]
MTSQTAPGATLAVQGVQLRHSRDVTLTYPDFTLPAGAQLAITGPSGTGKTTLLHVLAGLLRPQKGEVLYAGRAIGRMSEAERARFRRREVGYVFQDFHLMPGLTALENVELGLRVAGVGRARERARATLGRLDLADRCKHRPAQLSTGERQRVAVARAVAHRPGITPGRRAHSAPGPGARARDHGPPARRCGRAGRHPAGGDPRPPGGASAARPPGTLTDGSAVRLALWTALRGLRSRWVALLITVLAVALASATALVVPLVTRQVERGAQDAAQVFDLLVVAPGSATQALMSTLFYLDVPTGNLPHRVYQELRDAPGTRRAVPLALGDNYAGFPVVGTSRSFFDQRLKPSAPPYFRLAQGRLFAREHDAVIGARVAQASGLQLGNTFRGSHGLEERQGGEAESASPDHHGEPYRVTGILAPTGGPVDRAVLTPIETVWEVHGPASEAKREVTAVLYSAENLAGIYTVAQRINADKDAMAVFPGQVFAQARETLLQGQAAYAALSILVLGIAALTVWLSVYTSGLERMRTVSLLRALGAGRGTVFALVLLETLLTVSLGVGLGLGLALLVGSVGGGLLGARLGFTLAAPQLTWSLAARALALIPLGLLAALLPATLASRTSPLRHLNG